MINLKKGPAHSLGQTDRVGLYVSGQNVVAGQVVRLAYNAGKPSVYVGVSSTNALTDLLGFAANNYNDGDVLASGKIGVYLLDGSSVVETDQVDAGITITTVALGTPVSADTTGNVVASTGSNRIIGYVEGYRVLPNGPYTNGNQNITLLGIKLAV